jgi:hypothetical protein
MIVNRMHPLGFAYFPDGAHADMDEIEEDSLVVCCYPTSK